MDEFGSPLSGGIRAVRRNVSSSFLGAQRSQTDTISTNLLQEQSLKLTTVSSQLQNISRQITSLDFNLKAVRENLALSDQLERQREAAKQKRERQLAEQGLREGKESALERKIQFALTTPLRRIGQKTQGILSRVVTFLLSLAGGWLTLKGIDLLQAMAEGNVDKINRLKTKFIGGLTVLLGSLTAIQIGIKKTVGLISIFAGSVAKVAFGGVLRAALMGVRLLLAGLVKRSAKIGGGFFTGVTIGGIVEQVVGYLALGRLEKFLGNRFGKLFSKNVKIPKGNTTPPSTPFKMGEKFKNVKKTVSTNARKVFDPKTISKKFQKTRSTVSTGIKTGFKNLDELVRGKPEFTTTGPKFKFGGVDPTMNPNAIPRTEMFRRGGLLNRAKGLFNRGKTFIDDGLKAGKGLVDDGLKLAAKSKNLGGKALNLVKGLPKTGVGKLLGKTFGPLLTFFTELLSEDGGIMSALAAAGGFMAGAKVGAIAGGAIGALFGGVGAAPGAFIGALIGGFAGETLMKSLTKKIMSALGLKDIKVFNREKKDEEVEVDNKNGDGDNVTPKKNGNLEAANNISEFTEDNTEVIDLSQTNNSLGAFQEFGGNESSASSTTIPIIDFDNNNIHAATTSALTEVGP